MARRQRLHVPSAIYHVMLRGNDGQQIFFSDADKCKMCLLIQEGVERFGHHLYAFCFMTNHVHLALQVHDTNISKIIQNLAFRYTRYINRKQQRIGHLFQGRFKSILVKGDQYKKELIRYIHLNPVRAGLVRSPEEYLWSSHRAYMQFSELPWIVQDRMLKDFATNRGEAILRYNQFILEGIGVKSELDFKSGFRSGILGDEETICEIVEMTKIAPKLEIEFDQLVAKICHYYTLSETDLQNSSRDPRASQARAVLSLLIRESENLSIEKLAHFLGRESSGLSKLATRLEAKMSHGTEMADHVNCLRKEIYTDRMSECQA